MQDFTKPPTEHDALVAIVGALIGVLRDKRVLSEADAEEIAAEAFNRIRPPTRPEWLGGPENSERAQTEVLQMLQPLLAQTSLPETFLPKRWE